MLAVDDLPEALDRVGDRHVLAGKPGELLRDEEGLREEPLDLARARDRELVLFRQLVDAEDRDNVLQVLVALQHLLHGAGDVVVLVADDARVENARRGRERIDGRVDAELDDRARQVRRRVEMREGGRRRGVGVVVGRHVDRLDGSDRAVFGRRDPLLQRAHFRQQRRLVADRARHAAQERRDFRPGLGEAEDVVDEEEHVLLLGVAEVLGDRQAAERDAQARAWRFRHLSVDERRAGLLEVLHVDDAALLKLEPEVVALAGALPDAGEHRHAAVLHGDVVDQLLDDDRLADARAAEQADLAAAQVGLEQVDDLDARLEHLQFRRLIFQRRGRAVNRPALLGVDRPIREVDGLAEHVHDAPQRRRADRHRDRAPRVDDLHAAAHAVGRLHRDRAHPVLAEVLLDLRDDVDRGAGVAGARHDAHRVVDGGQLSPREFHVDDRPDDLDDLADFLCRCRCCCHNFAESDGAGCSVPGRWCMVRVPARTRHRRGAPGTPHEAPSTQHPFCYNAPAPDTTSMISRVIAACLTLFM